MNTTRREVIEGGPTEATILAGAIRGIDGRSGEVADAVADTGHIGYFTVDAERNLVHVSPELERITGFLAEEVVGKSCLTLIRCRECLRGCGVFEQGRVDDARLSLYRKDGEEITVVRSGRAVYLEDGTPAGALETVRLAEAAEPDRSRILPQVDLLLGGLGRLFIVADSSFRILLTSASLPGLIGSSESLEGVALARLLGEDLFGAGSGFRATIAEGKRREGWRAWLTTGRGERVAVSLSVGPILAGTQCGHREARYVLILRPEEEGEPDPVPTFAGIVGRSAPMQRIFRLIELLHDNDATVLITGESGTGKELMARALHARSSRANGPFVAVNCAALPADLLESELFGHVRGAFTGAIRDRAGRFELANHGTLFLDEIGDLAPSLQVKLLRVLQEHAFERVGETRTRQVDVRVVAATHVDLGRAVADRRFREDLFYRLRVVPIHVPPLRERRDDLPLLISHLLDKIGRRRGRALRLAPTALRALIAYDWPGNVRELENALEYATALCEGQTIHVTDLPIHTPQETTRTGLPNDGFTTVAANTNVEPAFMQSPANEEADPVHPGPGFLPPAVPVPSPAPGHSPHGRRAAFPVPDPAMAMLSPGEQAEVVAIRSALERARYRRDEAARLLGMSRTTLWRKMKVYRL
jgi:two-component system, NtrC family, response regulator AtoC